MRPFAKTNCRTICPPVLFGIASVDKTPNTFVVFSFQRPALVLASKGDSAIPGIIPRIYSYPQGNGERRRGELIKIFAGYLKILPAFRKLQTLPNNSCIPISAM